jgi:glycosyltransferase involved in cell wall biosynthesis
MNDSYDKEMTTMTDQRPVPKELSILICTHPNRAPLLFRMLWHLRHQLVDNVEIIVELNIDPITRGASRNKLLDKAAGKYCVFIDDDDIVADDYISQILTAIKSDPDICSIVGAVTSLWDNKRRRFVLSKKYAPVFTLPSAAHEDEIYYRYASHLCPIRTEIARKVRFPENMFNEDNGYSDRLKKYEGELKEVAIEKTIYYYFSRILLE